MIKISARTRNLEAAKIFLKEGFKILEITLPCPGGLKEKLAWKRLAQSSGVRLLAHGPEEGDPRILSRLEKEYFPQLRQALQEAQELGIDLLTIHLWLDPRWLDQQVITAKVELLSRLVDWGSECGVQINLENLSETWNDLALPLNRYERLGLTLDLGHAMLMHSSNTAPETIFHFYDRITHLHLHDNHGGQSPRDDLHLFPGQGKVPFFKIFKLLKERGYSRTATIELGPDEMAPARDWVIALWEDS